MSDFQIEIQLYSNLGYFFTALVLIISLVTCTKPFPLVFNELNRVVAVYTDIYILIQSEKE